MNFNKETRVNEIALSHPSARHILEDAGIDYCCGGTKSLSDACLRAKVPAEIILEQLRHHAQLRSPETDWTVRSLTDLTSHIRERHHRYVRDVVPRLRALLAKIREKHGNRHPELQDIEKLLEDVAHEMLLHMQKEDQILFPYIDSLERAASSGASLASPFVGTVRNPIRSMMQEHDFAGALVRCLRSASNAYQPPADACTSYRAAFAELRQFEEDLHLHVHLENNILFPRAAELEAAAV